MPMLQRLLEDRLQLKFHRDIKELPIYALEVAKSGKLHASEGECAPLPNGPPPAPQPGKFPQTPCGGMMMGFGSINGTSVGLAMLTPVLARNLGRTVVDKTGLKGEFDIKVQWTPDQALQGPPVGVPPDVPQPRPDPDGPSIFTAFQEQLGLKLESQKGPVEVIVIDHVEKPSEN